MRAILNLVVISYCDIFISCFWCVRNCGTATYQSSVRMVSTATKAARTPKPSRTPNTLLQRIHNHNVSHNNLLHDKLRNAITNLDFKVCLGEIREDNADRAAVVCVNDAGERVDAVLVGEAGSGCYSAIYSDGSESAYRPISCGSIT
jgi:hypothetical protein